VKEMEERWLRHSWAGAPVREKGGEAVRRARKGEKGGEGASTPFMASGVPCSPEGEEKMAGPVSHGMEERGARHTTGWAWPAAVAQARQRRAGVQCGTVRPGAGEEREKKVSYD
jgi:hypothetical protein